MAKLISGRVKRTPQLGITSDRYEFLGVEQAEPNLGDPTVGPSSIYGNPHPPGTQFLLGNVGGEIGKRYWIPVNQLAFEVQGPGGITIFDNNVQIGLSNSINAINFVGAGVSVISVGLGTDEQTGIATVQVDVFEVVAPGNEYEIAYNNPVNGYLDGATRFVYRDGNVGIGSSIPTAKLDVDGDVFISGITTIGNVQIASGIVTAVSGVVTYYGDFFGPIVGTAATASFATTAFNLVNAENILTGTISSSRLDGTYNISVTGSASTASFATTAFNLVDGANILSGTISSSRLTGVYDIDITGTAQNVISIVDQVVNASSLTVSGISSFYGSVGIATTSSDVALTVESYTLKTGIGTFIATAGIGYTVDVFNVNTYDFKTLEYTFHFEHQNNIQAQKILIMQNKSVSYGQEYAIMFEPEKIVSVATTVSGTQCSVSIIPETGINGLTTYRFTRGAML